MPSAKVGPSSDFDQVSIPRQTCVRRVVADARRGGSQGFQRIGKVTRRDAFQIRGDQLRRFWCAAGTGGRIWEVNRNLLPSSSTRRSLTRGARTFRADTARFVRWPVRCAPQAPPVLAISSWCAFEAASFGLDGLEHAAAHRPAKHLVQLSALADRGHLWAQTRHWDRFKLSHGDPFFPFRRSNTGQPSKNAALRSPHRAPFGYIAIVRSSFKAIRTCNS